MFAFKKDLKSGSEASRPCAKTTCSRVWNQWWKTPKENKEGQRLNPESLPAAHFNAKWQTPTVQTRTMCMLTNWKC